MRCIIIDDEPLAQDVIKTYIEMLPELQLMAVFSNPLEANTFLLNNKIDLIFVDIEMPNQNGISFIKSLEKKYFTILTTAYPQHALEGFEIGVVDYLLKPFSFERFYKAVEKSIDKFNESNEGDSTKYFFVKADGKHVRINISEILYVEGLKDYLKIFTIDSRVITHMTMKKMEETLPKSLFIRVHKSYIVSLKAIREMSSSHVLINNEKLPVGGVYKEQLQKNLFRTNS
jgi:DNA-binding LytR/AlgR family response regulator